MSDSPADIIMDEMSDGLERTASQIGAATGVSAELFSSLSELEFLGRLTSRMGTEGWRLYREAQLRT